MSLDQIRERVRLECMREQNVLGPSFFDEHIEVVARYGTELAIRLGADRDVVAIAAYLHDISVVRDFSTLPTHASDSAEIARDMLRELGYPVALFEQVAQCIRVHSTPIAMNGGTVEEVCLCNADAISQVVRPAFWCYFAYGIRRMGFEEGRVWLRERKRGNWEAMIEPARKLAREGYELSVDFLRRFEPPVTATNSLADSA